MKKAVLIVLLVASATIVWAAGAEETTSDTGRMSISWLGINPRGTLLAEDSMVELYLEEKFDVDIEPWYDVDNYAPEQYQVRIASGDIPDVSRVLLSQVELGVAREISKEMIAKYMPESHAKCLDLAPDTLWSKSEFEGKNFGIPYAISIAKASPLIYIRKDWMETVGYEGKPDTLAELEELFTMFRDMDPDQNGENDTYPYVVWTNNSESLDASAFFPNILGAFGVTVNSSGFTVRDGVVTRDSISDNYKEALKFLADWYDKGLIHPEFVNARREEANAILADGKAGVYEGWSAWATRPGLGPFNAMQADNPDVDLEYVISPAGPDGTRGVYQRDAAWGAVTVGKDVTDEKLIRIMQMLEVMFTDEETYAMVNLGKQGEHWDLDANGLVEFIGDSRDAQRQAELGTTYFLFHFIYPPIDKYYVPAWRYPAHNYALENQTQLPILYSPSMTEEYRAMLADLNLLEMEFAYQAISGVVDIDDAWGDYLDEWQKTGGQRLVDEANRLYGN